MASQGQQDDAALQGEAHKLYVFAVAALRCAGESGMLLKRKGWCSGPIAAGVSLFVVYWSVILIIYSSLWVVVTAFSAVISLLGASIYLRLVVFGVVVTAGMSLQPAEGSPFRDVQEALRHGVLSATLMALSALSDLLTLLGGSGDTTPPDRAPEEQPAQSKRRGHHTRH